MCLLMIHKMVIERCQVVEGAFYVVDEGRVVMGRKKGQDEEERKRPACMCDEWIEVGKSGGMGKV
jgi:hypothetical protein